VPPRTPVIRSAASHSCVAEAGSKMRNDPAVEMKMRRSTSESKMEKDRRNEDRAAKSRDQILEKFFGRKNCDFIQNLKNIFVCRVFRLLFNFDYWANLHPNFTQIVGCL
jgi:hypothetical protein